MEGAECPVDRNQPLEDLYKDTEGNRFAIEGPFTIPTRVDSVSGLRYFLDIDPEGVSLGYYDKTAPSRYALHPEKKLEELFRAATSTFTSSLNGGGVVESITFQAVKKENEDRHFVLEEDFGCLFGIFDGHWTAATSEYAVNVLPQLLSEALRPIIENPDTSDLDRVIEAAFTDVFKSFDESVISDATAIFASKPFEEWTLYSPEWKEVVDTGDNRTLLRRAVAGTTALVCLLSMDKSKMWVASLGDSQAILGRFKSGQWEGETLNEFHNCKNPDEVARLLREHPGEEVVRSNRVRGFISITRALGDVGHKVPLEVDEHLFGGCIWPLPERCRKWGLLSPPYISAKPSVTRHTVAPGDMILLASDGLRNAPQLEEFSEVDKVSLFLDLAGGRTNTDTSKWEKKLGHMLDRSASSGLEGVLRNILFGDDARKMAREVAMEVEQMSRYPVAQDDITIMRMIL